MSKDIDRKIEQCRVDILALQENLNKLLKQKKKEELPDIVGIELVKNRKKIVDYLKENPHVHGYKVFVTKYKGTVLLGVPMPAANKDWTFEAFDYAQNFCGNIDAGSWGIYPVFKYYVPDNDNLYIMIGY